MSERIAIIGAGNVGGALGARLVESGYRVCFGLREGGDASEVLASIGAGATSAPARVAAAENDVIFLALPGSAVVSVAKGLGDLSGKIVVDCNNTLKWDGGPVWTPPPEGSLTAALAVALPGARVLKAFNVFGAEFHRDPQLGDQRVDVFIAGDDADAKKTLSAIAERARFTPVDAGPLRNAAVLENVAILWIHLALAGGQGRDFAFKMVRRG